MSADIKHMAIIKQIEEDHTIVVMKAVAACDACQVKSVCGAGSNAAKEVKVHGWPLHQVVGDEVEIWARGNTLSRAVLFAYWLPLVFLLLGLVSISLTEMAEWQAILLALGVLVPYYSILYLFREKLNLLFRFRFVNQSTMGHE